jgi:hypothetical protein
MRFEGQMINSDALPWHYLLKYILITTPPTLLLLAAGGAFIALREFRRDRRSTRSFVGAVTLLWLLLPIGAFIVLRPCAYDGMRHFLFLLPALAVLAAIGVAGALAAARGRARWIAWPVVVALLLIPAKDVVGLHPYQSTFFNVFVGGLAGAEGRYETDYWVSSYREAMTWVNQRAAADSEHVFTVLVGGAPTLGEAASWYAAANVRARFVGRADLGRTLPAEVEYYLSTTRFGCDDLYPDAPIVHEIGRRGAVFCVIKAH